MNFLCLEFVNTGWYLKHKPFEERLKNEKWFEKFCSEWDLPTLDLTPNVVKRLLEFRRVFSQIILQVALEKTLPPENLKKVNEYLKLGRSVKKLRLENGEFYIDTLSQTADIDWMIYRISLSFANLVGEYPLKYLKKCENPECDWIFYDSSKSHTRKWCENRCASLMKVRKYRAREK